MICKGYIEGEKQKLDIVLEYSIAYSKELLLILIKINKGILIEDETENELPLYPY